MRFALSRGGLFDGNENVDKEIGHTKGRAMKSVLCLIFVCATLCLLRHSFANDTIVFDNGHNIFAMETDKIRMLSEKITVVMNRAKPGVAAASASVTCDFIFENTSEQEINAEVGFPTIYTGIESAQYISLDNFSSFVEGKEVHVEIKKETITDYQPMTDEPVTPYRYWYTWDVNFPPKKKLKITNTYETRLSEDSVAGRWFEYILTTGANWKGEIEESVIEVVYPDEDQLHDRVVKATPANFKINNNKIIWVFRNYVPSENIKVEEEYIEFRKSNVSKYVRIIISDMNIRTYQGDKRLYVPNDLDLTFAALTDTYVGFGNVYTKDIYLDDVRRVNARVLRNEIFARHGRIFKSEDLKAIFESTNWYKPNPNYSDDMLNDIEKKNIQFILDYDKKMGWR